MIYRTMEKTMQRGRLYPLPRTLASCITSVSNERNQEIKTNTTHTLCLDLGHHSLYTALCRSVTRADVRRHYKTQSRPAATETLVVPPLPSHTPPPSPALQNHKSVSISRTVSFQEFYTDTKTIWCGNRQPLQ